MPARVSKNNDAAAPSKDPNQPEGSTFLARLLKLEPHIQRLVVSMGAALVGTCALGAAANHFLSGDKSGDQVAKTSWTTNSSPAVGGNYGGGWWNPSGADSTPSSTAYGRTAEDHGSSASSGSVSVIPANTGMPVFSGTLTVGNLAPIGANNSGHAYDILGLRTSNTPTLAVNPQTSITANSSTLVSFSLAGNIAQVPVNNLEAGGLNMVPATTIPEPTTSAMLALGVAGFALARRRNSKPVA